MVAFSEYRPERADHVAAEIALVARDIVDVGVQRLRRRDAGKIVDARSRAEMARQKLIGAAAELEAARTRRRVGAIRVHERGVVIVEHVRLERPVVSPAEVVAVLAADALAGIRIPVVEDGRVLAAIDRPEERVVNRLAAQRRRAVGRDEKPGGPVFLFRGVVQHRQVEHRHPLHPEHGLLQEGVVIDVESDGVGDQIPARRRLHAGREAALRDLVLLGTELLDRLAEEVDDRLLTGHRRRRDAAGAHLLTRRLDGRDPVRVVERAETRVGVELDPFR